MTHIGLLSDTHGYLDERIFKYFDYCDEIWHAGDIGSIELIDKLSAFKPLRAVYGNIDDHIVRMQCPEHQKFMLEGYKVWMTHIGGYPGHYTPKLYPYLTASPPDIFICGHSHILRILYDKKWNFLTINPGAAGKHGFQKVRTLVRFSLHNKSFQNMEVIELH